MGSARTDGVSVRRVELRENVRAFFLQGHSKLSVKMRCPLSGVGLYFIDF